VCDISQPNQEKKTLNYYYYYYHHDSKNISEGFTFEDFIGNVSFPSKAP